MIGRLVDRSLYPPFFAVDPVFDELRDDARFGDLMGRVDQAKLEAAAPPDRLSSS